MSPRVAVLFFLLVAGHSVADPPFKPPQATAAHSFSGQFIVHAVPATARPAPPIASTNQTLIRLEPTLVTVSCERIKQLLNRELGVNSAWAGKIFLTFYPAQTADQPVTILSERFRNGWQYRVELPDQIERIRYVRSIVRVLLTEFANRNGDLRSAEIPPWLSEGFTQQFMSGNEIEIILPAPKPGSNGLALASANISARRETPQLQVQKKLQTRPPLTFDELSWPTEEQWTGEAGEVYRSSAQLFLNSLLQLKDGRACLQRTLADLSHHYNWQFAFLNGFAPHFQRTLDVDKWWSLQMVHFTGRDVAAQTWRPEESWQQLDRALHATVEIHTSTNDLPLRAGVTLQKVIRDADPPQRKSTLQAKLTELDLLRLRCGADFLPLVDKYRQTLQLYLQRASDKKEPTPAGQETVNQLNELDSLRLAMRSSPKPVIARKP